MKTTLFIREEEIDISNWIYQPVVGEIIHLHDTNTEYKVTELKHILGREEQQHGINIYTKLIDNTPTIEKFEKGHLETSFEWNRLLPFTRKQFHILDPDGWDRSNWGYSWFEEEITLEEFVRRLGISTAKVSSEAYDYLHKLIENEKMD